MKLKLVRFCGNACCPHVPHAYRRMIGGDGLMVCDPSDWPYVGSVHEVLGKVLKKRQAELDTAIEVWNREEGTVLEVDVGGVVVETRELEVRL